MKAACAIATALVLAGCPKEKPSAGETDAGATSAAGSASSAAAASTVASQSAATAAPGAPAAYEGKYTAAPSPLYIPSDSKDYASVKQAKDDPSKMVGEGAIALRIEPDGRVSGTIDSGPASPAIIEGSVAGDELTATVRRKEAGDDGLSGALRGKVGPAGVEGTMTLSDARAGVLRSAKFSTTKK